MDRHSQVGNVTGTDCVSRNWSACDASNWIFGRVCCTCVAARMGFPAPIHCADQNSEPYAR
jgi:hypothetical protein